MMNTKNQRILLTVEAEKRLTIAVDAYRERIMTTLSENHFVPGESLVEITGSHVDKAVEELRFGRRDRIAIRKLYSQMVLIMGIAIFTFGILYSSFLDALQNPVQAIALGLGAYLTLGGLMYYRLSSLRDIANRGDSPDIQDRLLQLERILATIKRYNGESHASNNPMNPSGGPGDS